MNPLSQGNNNGTWFDRLCRSLVHRRLRTLQDGALCINDHKSETCYGQAESDLLARIEVQDPQFYRRLVFGGGLGAAESLMDGEWHTPDATALVRLFIRNMQVSDRWEGGLAMLRGLWQRVAHALRRNTRGNSVRNIREHYDLGNDFYQLMLDDTMSYSCVYFAEPNMSLAAAARAKLDLVCRKLRLEPDDELLEIGGGWGGLALYAARHYGCRVTTTTISRQQYEFAAARVRAAGLEDRITVLQQDYRDLSGNYDKLVSIEMIEAVGHEYFPTFFRQCATLLKPAGRMLLQGITIKDQRYRQHLRSVDFIRKYIFPGGCLPSVGALLQAAASASDLQLLHLEDLTPHYVRTLQCWRERFWERRDEVRQLGFTERFLRMWLYYLCYCEATFTERQTQVVQMEFAHPQCDRARHVWQGTSSAIADDCIQERVR